MRHGIRHVDDSEVSTCPSLAERDPRVVTAWPVLNWSAEHLLDFFFIDAMPVDVRLPRGRIDVVPNLHLLILGRQADEANHDGLASFPPRPLPGASDRNRPLEMGARTAGMLPRPVGRDRSDRQFSDNVRPASGYSARTQLGARVLMMMAESWMYAERLAVQLQAQPVSCNGLLDRLN